MTTEQSVHTATDEVSNVKDVVKSQASDVAREAQTKASDLVRETKSQFMRQAGDQGQRLSGVLKDVSDQLHAMSSGGDPGPVRDLTAQAAGAVASAGDRLSDRGVDGLVEDITAFARRRPAAFLVGAGIAGFVAARVFRNASSLSGDSGSGSGTGSTSPPTAPSLSATTAPAALPTSDAGAVGALGHRD